MRGTAGWRFLAGVALVSIGLGVLADTAWADPPSGAGWWTSENPGLSVDPLPTLVPTGGPTPLPSDIPPGGFEVQHVGDLVSYAAIAFESYGLAAVRRIVLKLAAGAADVPGSSVEACPLTGSGSFADTYGGPLTLGPPYDCATAVPGAEDSMARTISFDVQRFVHADRLAVAIVAVGTSRLVFSAADRATIVATATSAPNGGVRPTPPPLVQPAEPAPVSAPNITPPSATEPVQPSPLVIPTVTSRQAAAPQLGGGPATSALVAVTEPDATTGPGSAVIGGLVLLAACALVVQRNRRALGSPTAQSVTSADPNLR